jgi:hypothetical protein
VKVNLATRANAYRSGIRTAERIGLERGSRGDALEPCYYRKADYIGAYERGWRTGMALFIRRKK